MLHRASNLCTSGYEVGWAGHVASMMKERDAFNVLVVKPKGRRPFVKPKRIWDDNIKMYHKKIVCVD
jgi:hypothetical protein